MNEDVLKIGDKAGYYFENGFHCAEAIVASVLEGLDKDPSQVIAQATAFGGGFGKTFDEACGALTGSLIVIGHLHGRNNPGEDWDLPAQLAQDMRERFIENFKTTHCATLRHRFGEELQSVECGKLVEQVAKDLMDILSKPCEGTIEPCGCEVNTA